MLKLLKYLLTIQIATLKTVAPDPPADWRGLPALTDEECQSGCSSCAKVCPTEAIAMLGETDRPEVAIDLGACIQCGLCFAECPTGTIVENKTFRVAATSREDLVLVKDRAKVPQILERDDARSTTNSIVSRKIVDLSTSPNNKIFADSLHVRSVSTGCSSCDAEVSATYSPTYDMERFGCSLVASPRHADALLITGPVGKAMHSPLERCYEAMAEPRIVIAVGTCAISGGVHKGGYASANGADALLPVSVYIPGCPPHPWSIIHGVLVAMGKMEPFKPEVLSKRPASDAGEKTSMHFTES